MFLGRPDICQFTSSNFHIIPYWSPWSSPVEKLFLSLTPENVWIFLIFFGDSSNPHQDSEIRCLDTSSRKYLLQFIKRRSKVYQKNMSRQKTLKSNQSILFSQNYMQTRLLLWLADNITESSCIFQLFTVFIQTPPGTFPTQNEYSNLKTTYHVNLKIFRWTKFLKN